MRTTQPRTLGTKQPDLSLSAQIIGISEVASLGYHPAALIRLADGSQIIFTERYPDLEIPVNGRNAKSLFDVGTSDGPSVQAVEFNLAIYAIKSVEQVRDLRRARAIIPELQIAEVTDSSVKLSHSTVNRSSYYNEQALIRKLFKSSFGERHVIFDENHDLCPPEISLCEQTLSTLNKIFHAVWSNSKSNSTKHIQSFALDLAENYLTFFEQGPYNPKHERSQNSTIAEGLQLNLQRTRHNGQIWHDSARAALFGIKNPPEALRIYSIAHELFVTALSNRDSDYMLKKPAGLKGLPFEIRALNVDNSQLDERQIFDLLPHDWRFRGVRISATGEKILIDADPPLNASDVDEVVRLIGSQIKKEVFLPTTRFRQIEFDSCLGKKVMERAPFGAVALAIKECQVTGDIELHTVNSISDATRESIQELVGVGVSNVSAKNNPPQVIKEPAALISSNALSPVDVNIPRSEARKLTIHGGSGIGGSALTFGPILLDCGAIFNQNAKKDSLEELFRAGKIKAAFITHSHLDHVGAAFQLAARNMPIFMHYGTAIASWQILQEQTRKNTQFTRQALEKFYNNIQPLPYGYPIKLSEELSATLAEAGHVTGSSMVILNYEGKDGSWRAAYTSDLQGSEHGQHHRIYPPAARTAPLDALIIEATNGMEPIPPRQEIERLLIDSINESLKRGGQVLLPTLATKGPELLTLLVNNHSRINAPIYIDGPALMNVNQISDYLASTCPDLFVSRDWTSQGWHGTNTGAFKEISRTGTKEFFKRREKRVVVMSGGMGQGSAEQHIANAKPEDTIIFSSYQAPGTFGALLLEREQAIKDSSTTTRETPRAMQIRLSGHITGLQILDFVKECLKPDGTVVLTHGSHQNKLDVKQALTEQGIAKEIIIAENGATYDLK